MGRRFDTIRTERLVLRRWRDADRAPFAALNADPEVMRYFPATLDRVASDSLVNIIEARFDHQGFGLWALELASTAEFIGFTGLNPMPSDVPGAGGMEVGWRLARAAWHQGYATEAATAAAQVALTGAGLTRTVVNDGRAQRAVAGRDAADRHDPVRLLRASPDRAWSPAPPARRLPAAKPRRA